MICVPAFHAAMLTLNRAFISSKRQIAVTRIKIVPKSIQTNCLAMPNLNVNPERHNARKIYIRLFFLAPHYDFSTPHNARYMCTCESNKIITQHTRECKAAEAGAIKRAARISDASATVKISHLVDKAAR